MAPEAAVAPQTAGAPAGAIAPDAAVTVRVRSRAGHTGPRRLPSSPAFVAALVALGAALAGCSAVRLDGPPGGAGAPAPPAATPAEPAADPSGGTASAEPPGALAPVEVPQFVVLGFDDNGASGMPEATTHGGIRFVVDLFAGRRNPTGRGNAATFDRTPALASFYVATRYLEVTDGDQPQYVKRALHAALAAGHEIGLHTHNHAHGAAFSSAQWAAEIDACAAWLAKPFDTGRAAEAAIGLGVPRAAQLGFRAPFLEYGPPLFAALRERGLAYDCSVETGFEDRYDGTNLPWPYRVASGYGMGASTAGAAGDAAGELWELPVYALIVPPDEACARYGVPPGLRGRLHQTQGYFRPEDGKITGFDWNLWVEFQMSAPEVVATFRYTLDQRLAGNRAPLTLGTHSDIYSDEYAGITGSTAEERRRALAAILDDALARPAVRVVSGRQLLAWLRAPSAL